MILLRTIAKRKLLVIDSWTDLLPELKSLSRDCSASRTREF